MPKTTIMPKTIVIGLGNPILTDDGVGVQVAAQVEAALAAADRRNVTVAEAGVGGLRLMEMLEGYDRAILIDAMDSREAARPGAVHKLTLDDLRAVSPTQHTASAHDTNLTTALAAGARLGLTLPDDVVIYGVEVENTLDFGEQPTPAVAEAIPRAAAAVLMELDMDA